MDEYIITLTPKAGRDLEEIYSYIADNLKKEGTAQNMADLLEDAILGLRFFPNRGAVRKTGSFAQKGYKQICRFVEYPSLYAVELLSAIIIAKFIGAIHVFPVFCIRIGHLRLQDSPRALPTPGLRNKEALF